jgi:hypothetical protein
VLVLLLDLRQGKGEARVSNAGDGEGADSLPGVQEEIWEGEAVSCEHDMANGTCSQCDPYVVQNLRAELAKADGRVAAAQRLYYEVVEVNLKLQDALSDLRKRKDDAYEERNRVVVLLARMAIVLGWKAGVGTHEDKPGEEWESDWRSIVCIELPTGQASWHLHDSHKHLLTGLPRYEAKWDGHTTGEKYRRLQEAFPVRVDP